MTDVAPTPSLLASSPVFTILLSTDLWFIDPSGNCLAIVQPKG